MKMQDEIAIGWIDPGLVDSKFMLSMLPIYRDKRQVTALLNVEGSGLVSRMRNEIVARFLDTTHCQWLLMIDADEQLSMDGFDQLTKAAHSTDRPIMAGLYFGAWPGELYPNPIPLIYRHAEDHPTRYAPIYDYPPNRIIPVDAAGTGCLLIHRSVFERIREGATQHEGPDWCWFHDMPVNGDWFSEDLFFCRRAESVGFKMHAHTGVVLPHRKKFWQTDRHFRASREQAVNPPTPLKKPPLETAVQPPLETA